MRLKFRRKKNNLDNRPKHAAVVCVVISALFFALFCVRLADWQLVHGEEYRGLSRRSTGYTVETEAVRGEILDKNGEGLVVNETHYRLVIDKLYADEDSLCDTLLFLIELMDDADTQYADILPISLSPAGNFYFSANDGDTSEKQRLLSEDYLNAPDDISAEECIRLLEKRYELEDKELSDEQLRSLAAVLYNMEVEGYSNSNPYIFAPDIDRDKLSAISENTQGISGVDVQTYMVRSAPDGDLAPHLLGAQGSLSEEEYQALRDEGKNYSLSDLIGKFGVELAFEDYLKGTGGTKIIQRSADGNITEAVEATKAKQGDTVYLTIDKSLQQTAVNSLAKNVESAREYGKAQADLYGTKNTGEDCEAGAVVMLSVKDFSVLAAASFPTYDLNKYSEYSDYYVKLVNDDRSPMYNRAFVGSFACGSVIKPLVAAAALEEGVIDKDTQIYCKKSYDYYPSNVVNCMHYHGNENVTGAITQSCNYFFAETGRRLGIEAMYLYAERFGMGEYTGIETEESKGTLAGRDSEVWMPGNTVQAAIGQSDNAFTPLQLAAYTATLANDGVRLKTRLMSKITSYERTKTLETGSAEKAADCGVSQKNLEIVQNAMLSVTQSESGTAHSVFGNYKIKVAAKTGTAENSGSDHTTFICYAPFDDPEVAIAVVIEHGARGMYSMQVAKDLLDEYFSS